MRRRRSTPTAVRPARALRRVAHAQAFRGEELRTILNGLPAMVGYWDRDLRNRIANDAYVEYFGWRPEAMLGVHIRDVLGPELYERNRPYMLRALAGEPQLFDRTIIDTTGRARHTQASYIPDAVGGEVRGFFVLVTDITARREAEERLAEAEARFRTLFESAPIGEFIVSADRGVVDINPAGCALLGRTREEVVGRSVDEYTHPDDRAVSQAYARDLFDGRIESYRLEKRYIKADGSIVWTQLDTTLVPATKGRPALAIGQVQDVSDRRRHEAELRYLAEHDALTGLLNRRGLEAELERQADTARRYGTDAALVVIDLDNFKQVNDTLGHHAGDALLAEVAQLIRERVRSTDVVARMGGDEFAIVVPHGGLEAAEQLGEAIGAILRERPPVPGTGGAQVTASIGVTPFEPGLGAEEVLVAADVAMYAAKAAGRDRVVADDASLSERPAAPGTTPGPARSA